MGGDDAQRSPREFFCAEILRLPPGVTEPDHYTLLGLGFFEPDHGTIVRAAMERIRLLEACQADPRPGFQKALLALLAEVRAAQITLLDPRRRKTYDATLIGRDEAGGAQDEEQDDEIELRPGTMVAGRYRVLGERRLGGLGLVHDALDSNLRTRVELSVLRPRLSGKRTARRRSERAARAAALLDHPNIVRVDEVGDAEGLLFMRTRQVEGKNLLESIEATPRMRLEPDRVRDVTRQIATALAYAHERETMHGDLRPHNVFLNSDGRTMVADFCVSRAVLDALEEKPPRTRAPENENTPAADLFSLGSLAYQMLAGMPPFTADTTHFVPRPLPDDVPEDLEVLVTRLLARDPRQRPASAAEVVERLTPRMKARRLPMLLVVAAVLVVALVIALIATRDDEGATRALTVREQAWQLIADERFDEAIEQLRAARRETPADRSLRAPLADALDRRAAVFEQGGDIWGAQLLLREAQEVAPQAEREEVLARVRRAALDVLEAIAVSVPACSPAPAVRAEVGDAFAGKVEIAGRAVPIEDGVARLDLELEEGAHEVAYVLEDRVGNRVEGKLATTVDTQPPVVAILEPADGALFRKGDVFVKLSVADENPPDAVVVRTRSVGLKEGEASTTFKLEDGEHTIEAIATDRAGLQSRTSIKVIVDSTAPDVELAAERVVTPDGAFVVRGHVSTKGASVTVGGKPASLEADGSFEVRMQVAADGLVPVEATGPTGLKKKVSVRVEIDRDPPRLAVDWNRRGAEDVLLYGAREMDAGGLRLRVRVSDKTRVRLEALDGKLEGDFWVVEAHEGKRVLKLAAVDEAGNRRVLNVKVDGHRATPVLVVKNETAEFTSDEEAVLEIEADGTLYLQGEKREPGRIKLPMPEGRFEMSARAVDHYGNESRWSRTVQVDRTPPKVELAGGEQRGVGRQKLQFDANEVLVSLTCFGKTTEVNAKTARVTADLKVGRRRLTVVAKDRAGNTTKASFTLRVINRVLLLDGFSAVRVDIPKDRGRLTDFTLECWVRGYEAKDRSVVCSRSARQTGFAIFWSREDRGLPYGALVVQGAGFTSLPARKGWKWERWTHLALCFDAESQRARFFVNGSLHHTVAVENPLATGNKPLLVGAGSDARNKTKYFFKGAIDELRLSNVARYTRGFSAPRYLKQDDKTLVLLRFDTMVNDRFEDTSGNGFHGRAVGAPRLAEENR
jgi:hypothetical protein